MKIVGVLLAFVLVGAAAAHAQTWLTDPAFGAQRNAYGPGVHMDATGRPYYDAVQGGGMPLGAVRPDTYGLGVGSDATGRPIVPTYTPPRGSALR
jgi:hypothetical protein